MLPLFAPEQVRIRYRATTQSALDEKISEIAEAL
jgi:hypothetical protein